MVERKHVSSFEAITEFGCPVETWRSHLLIFLYLFFFFASIIYIYKKLNRIAAHAFRDLWSLVIFFKFSSCTRRRSRNFESLENIKLAHITKCTRVHTIHESEEKINPHSLFTQRKKWLYTPRKKFRELLAKWWLIIVQEIFSTVTKYALWLVDLCRVSFLHLNSSYYFIKYTPLSPYPSQQQIKRIKKLK